MSNKWIAWHGLEDKPPTNKLVTVLFRDGTEGNLSAHPSSYHWAHFNFADDIVAYKVLEKNV